MHVLLREFSSNSIQLHVYLNLICALGANFDVTSDFNRFKDMHCIYKYIYNSLFVGA